MEQGVNNLGGKFTKTWGTQTDIGRHFNLSAVALGKLLVSAGLRDATTKEPTMSAINDGYAMSTPLKSGRPFFMWNRAKLADILREQGLSKASPTDVEASRIVSEIRTHLKIPLEYEGSKMEDLTWDILQEVFDDMVSGVDKNIRADVRAKALQRIYEAKITDSGWLK